MIRQPLGVRLDAAAPLREQIREAATLGAKGVLIEASGDLHPDRLGESGRRDVRHLLRSVELGLVGLYLPTRNPFDRADQLEERLLRADHAFAMAYELGTKLVLVRAGAVPPEGEADATRRALFDHALDELGRRADRRGVRLALEAGTEPASILRGFLEARGTPALAGSVDPGALLLQGLDPIEAIRVLGPRLAHAYATDAATGARIARVANPRGPGFPPGALDWEEFLGSLEEVGYVGYLTAYPEPGRMSTQLPALIRRLNQF